MMVLWSLLIVVVVRRTSSRGVPTPAPSIRPNSTNGLMNFCDRLTQLANVSDLQFKSVNALAGRTITIGVNLDTPPQMMTFDPITKQPNGGLMYLVQQVRTVGRHSPTRTPTLSLNPSGTPTCHSLINSPTHPLCHHDTLTYYWHSHSSTCDDGR